MDIGYRVNARRRLKIDTFMNMTLELSKLSVCKRASVACMLVTPDFRRIDSIGYNGRFPGENHDACSGKAGECGCVHAEINALLKIGNIDQTYMMFSTTSPCLSCAAAIIASSRVQTLFYHTLYREAEGLALLSKYNIEHTRIPELK